MATKLEEKTYVPRICATCGGHFTVQYQVVLAGGGTYCSRNCNPTILASIKSRIKSPELGRTHDFVTRTCPTCNTEFKTKVKNINRGGGTYCSNTCNPKITYHIPSPEELSVGYSRRNTLWSNYKITVIDYDNLLKAQNGCCAICLRPPNDNKFLNVDHCHTTGKIRGLLCSRCNPALGKLKDSKELLLKAIEYLEKHEVS